MQDFDIARHEKRGETRAFRISGREFTFKPSVSADLLADYYDTTADPDRTNFNRSVVEAADRLILAWLEPGQEDAWRQVRAADNPDAVTIVDMQDVIRHMTGSITGRDQEQPSGSSSTSLTPGTSSTAPSPSPAAA